MRVVTSLDGDWQYSPGRRRGRWLRTCPDQPVPPTLGVELPHCWNATDAYRFGVDYRRGSGSYRTRLIVESSTPGRIWRLEVGPFYGRAEVLVDGARLIEADGQFLGFGVDLPATVASGSVLALRLDNRYRRSALPSRRDPDFLLYGGLTGGVRLWELPAIRLGRVRVEPQLSSESAVPGESARLQVGAALTTAGDRRPGEGGELGAGRRLHVRVLDRRGTLCAEASSQEGCGELALEVPSVERWWVDDPRLYSVVVSLLEEGGVEVDRVVRRIGFRRARFDSDGFFLNDERLLLAGCNRHESLPGFGAALPRELQRRDVELLRGIGANMVRLSHYPQSEDFLDACDELGLLVYAELASWKSVGESKFLPAAREQFTHMIERDRHRPSVVIWGMGNESRSRRAYVELGQLARELDGTRPVSYAENHLYRAQRENTMDLVDVWGLNYELDVLDEVKEGARSGCVLVTECMNPCLRGEDADTEARQLMAMQEEWPEIVRRPFVAGYLVWCFADYATLYRKRYRRVAGLFDAWRRPRAGAWLFRARHGTELFVHLEAEWQREGSRENRRIRVYTNAAQAQLWAGEEQLATVEEGQWLMEGRFRFRDVTLEARAGRGDEVVSSRVEPWGPPAQLDLVAHPIGSSRRWFALDVRVLDREGTPAPSWGGLVTVKAETSGRVHSYDGAGTVEIVHGAGTSYVRVDGPASLEVIARGEGLDAGRLTIEASEEPTA